MKNCISVSPALSRALRNSVLAVALFTVGADLAHAVQNGTVIPESDLTESANFSWLVRLQNAQGETVCTGVLVDSSLVLTAAHAFDGPLSSHPSMAIVGNAKKSVSLTQIIKHPDYAGAGKFDVALVRLQTPSIAIPVSLPDIGGAVGDDLAVGDVLTVAGWGGQTGGKALPPAEGLMQVADLSMGTFIVDPALAFVCDGDSGGPFLREGSAGRILVGVTSFSEKTNCVSGFGGATRVTSVLSWLRLYTVNVSVQQIAVSEPAKGKQKVDVTVSLSQPPDRPVTVTLAPLDDTAKNGIDYLAKTESVRFKVGQTSSIYSVTVLADDLVEFGERFLLEVSADGAAVFKPRVPFKIKPAVNTPPVVLSGTLTTPKNTPVEIPIEFSDPDGPLTLTAIDFNTASVSGGTIGYAGSLIAEPPTTFTFTPNPGFIGTAFFSYTVSDGEDSASATWTIQVTGENTPPTVASGTLGPVPMGSKIWIPLRYSDVETPWDQLVPAPLQLIGLTFTGGIRGASPETLEGEFQLDPSFVGQAVMSLTISDGQLETTGTWTIDVVP